MKGLEYLKCNGRANAEKWMFIFTDGDVSDLSQLDKWIEVLKKKKSFLKRDSGIRCKIGNYLSGRRKKS